SAKIATISPASAVATTSSPSCAVPSSPAYRTRSSRSPAGPTGQPGCQLRPSRAALTGPTDQANGGQPAWLALTSGVAGGGTGGRAAACDGAGDAPGSALQPVSPAVVTATAAAAATSLPRTGPLSPLPRREA